RFLNTIEEQVPLGKVIHAIVDNYATHKHPKVRQWLARHPRWTFHFTPTSASWLNAVEGFFAKLTRRRLKRGVFRSVADLQAAINHFVAETNFDPKPFVWTADPKRVLAAVKRGKETLESIHYVLLLHAFDAAVLLLGRTLSNCDAHFDRGSPHRDASGLRARDDCGPCRRGNPFDEEFDDRAVRMI